MDKLPKGFLLIAEHKKKPPRPDMPRRDHRQKTREINESSASVKRAQFIQAKASTGSLRLTNSTQIEAPRRVKQLSHTNPRKLTPAKLMLNLKDKLTKEEVQQLKSYQEVYYIGNPQTTHETEKNYSIETGDHIQFRYEVLSLMGEGAFSKVIMAFDHKLQKKVAIKITKDMSTTYGHSLREIEILQVLQRTYKEHNCSTELIEDFVYRGHKMMVFPLYYITLRDALNQLPMLKRLALGKQLFQAVSQFHRLGIIHCDLKPENVMFDTSDLTQIKIIDFGSASPERHQLYSLIQTRYYRAPEVILGCSYSAAVDIWSVGCILAELYTGRPLFHGYTDQEQLFWIMEVKGIPPSCLLAQARHKDQYFSPFGAVKTQAKGQAGSPGTKSLRKILKGANPEYVQLIEQCLEWDPALRIKASEALNHRFFSEKARDRKLVKVKSSRM